MNTVSQKNSDNRNLNIFSDLTEFDEPLSFEKLTHPLIEKYIVFSIDEVFYAIHSSLVAEVLNPLPVFSLPNLPEWLCGVANLRGHIISVVDLRKFWQKKTPAPANGKLIILKSKKSAVEAAFLVDRLHEIVSLAPSDIKFSAADFENSFPTLFGKAVDNGNSLLLIDAEKLLASLNLENAR